MASLKTHNETTVTNTKYLFDFAESLYKQKKFEAAVEIYKAILQKEVKNETALKGLGSCLYFLRSYENAHRCFQCLEKLFNSECATVWIYACLISLHKTKEAKEYVKHMENINLRIKDEGIALDFY